MVQFSLYKVAKGARLIYLTVTEKVFPSTLSMVNGQEHGLYHVFHIDKSEVLAAVAYREIHMLLDTLGHEEVVFLPGTVYSRGTQYDIREILQCIEKLLCLQFAAAIGRVGTRHIVFGNVLIRLLLADSSVNTQ